MTSDLTVSGLHASYGSNAVLHGVDLKVGRGCLTAVLGPSGCGKSTLLRVVAGFHRATSGMVSVGDRLVDDGRRVVPPERRRITIVPQDGALFPHLTVAANVAYGLAHDPGRASRTAEMLQLVGLQDLGDRYPHELSGGQQQRVAVARALAPRPAFVLLDEPFSALDAHLREVVRRDVRDLIRLEGATAVLVTHDQGEALSLADDVAVMRDGVILQQATPREVYTRPADAWVAAFVGDAIVLDARIEADVAHTVLGPIGVDGPVRGHRVVLRPEQLTLGDHGADARVRGVEFRGDSSLVQVHLGTGQDLLVRHHGPPPRPDDTVRVSARGTVWSVPD
ncbi:ABC transporter, ATP-binding protein [Aeromicrobium marinum DSM 15272]|uniref:ABC-type quaternary amine transporter n=1 Tax=Aeromicrobium marinum DSM 15272 TaxID=585531 RepID=E2S9Q3_9ACTN|nr:ABC transporter ATP-binding protein [Aeromicrobium marinum]EFQ83977.1 ABC transporter, ATP-binding protein [Aeromicrobium marinum DSM 15272]